MSKIGQSSVLKLGRELYDHLLRQPASFFDKHRTNFLVSRLVVNCSAIELAVSANLRDMLRESFMLICFLSAAFYFNWKLMLGALLLAPVIGFLTTRFSKSLRRLVRRSRRGQQDAHRHCPGNTCKSYDRKGIFGRGPRERPLFRGGVK